MGNNTAKKELINAIELSNPDKLYYILKKFPDLANQKLDSDTKHTPLIRALWKQDYAIARILLADFQCDPNQMSENLSPLATVAIKNNIELLNLLIEFKVEVHSRLENNFTAMDYAIAFGSYDIAYYLSRKFSAKISHDIGKFQKLAQSFNIGTVDYVTLLILLCQEVHPSKINKFSFLKSGNGSKRIINRKSSVNNNQQSVPFLSNRNMIKTQVFEQVQMEKDDFDEPTLQVKSNSNTTEQKSQGNRSSKDCEI